MDNNGTTTRIAGNLSQAMGPSTTTTTFPATQQQQLNGYVGVGYQYTYPYQWQTYYPDYSLTGRIATLEGEVKVLREMVAALLSGKAQKAPAKR